MALELNTIKATMTKILTYLIALSTAPFLFACSGQPKPYSHPDLERNQTVSRQASTSEALVAYQTKLALSALMNARVSILQAFQPDFRVTPCSFVRSLRKGVDNLSFFLNTACFRWGSDQITLQAIETFQNRSGASAHPRPGQTDVYDMHDLTIASQNGAQFWSENNPKRVFGLTRNLSLSQVQKDAGQATYTVTNVETITLPAEGDAVSVETKFTVSGRVVVNYMDLSFVWETARVLVNTVKGSETWQLVFAGEQLSDMNRCVRPQGNGRVEKSKDGINDMIKSNVLLSDSIALTDIKGSAPWDGCAPGDLPGIKNYLSAATALGL